MKIGIYHLLCLALLLFAALTEEQPTQISYFVEYEVEQEDDYIEVLLEIESQSRSLVEAINSAKITAYEVTTLANNYCKEHTKKGKGDCKEAVEITQFEIEPQYQIVRKQATFSTFIVKHDLTIKVFNTEPIGYLIDSFLKYPDLTIKTFEWLPLQEVDSEEAAIKEGLEQGEGLCEQIGQTLGRVLNIEEIVKDEEAAPKDEGDEQDEEEEEPELVIYKFQVECTAAKKPKAK